MGDVPVAVQTRSSASAARKTSAVQPVFARRPNQPRRKVPALSAIAVSVHDEAMASTLEPRLNRLAR